MKTETGVKSVFFYAKYQSQSIWFSYDMIKRIIYFWLEAMK